MIELNANVARFHFEAVHLAPETFQVAGFSGREEISQPFRFDFDLVSRDPFVDFAEVVNQSATFTMMRGLDAVPVHGVVAYFEQAGRTADHVAYRATLVPRLWWLSLNYQSRVFQQRTVIEIVQHVLDNDGPQPIPYRFDLLTDAVYRPRSYCVQYCETDLDFINRLLEFEGISYFFEPFGEHERIVFTDHPHTFAPITGKSTILYHQGAGMVGKEIEKVHDLVCREQVVTGRVLVKDYNHETPDVDLRAESQLNGAMPGTQYEYGLHFDDVDEGKRLAQIRNQEIEARRRVLHGKSDCMGFRSGFLFTLANHYRSDLNEAYLLTRVEHRGSQKKPMGLAEMVGGDGQESSGLLYANTFTCIPADVPYRPLRRTPVPQVPGIMTARLEARDPGDKYAFLDEEGCYRARMHFDLRNTNEAPPADASKPIRMNQPYSGSDYGVHFPNHAGTEMVWSCINGNPDRPMALGTVPHAHTRSPSTSANEPQSVIRTAGGNELTFDDTEKAENIYMHATKNHTVQVTNNESISVGNDQRITVGDQQVIAVGGAPTDWGGSGPGPQSQEITVHGARYKTIHGFELNSIDKGRQTYVTEGDQLLVDDFLEVSVTGDQRVSVSEGNRTVTLADGNDTLQVDMGNRVVNLAVGNDERNILSGNRTVTLNAGDDTLTAAAGSIERLAPAGTYRVQAMQGVIECVESLKFVCGASTIELTPSEIRINGPFVKINC